MRAKDNPFTTERLHQIRYRFRNLDWQQLLARLAQMNYRAAIVGRDGSGKTLLLTELAERLTSIGFQPYLIRLNQTEGLWRTGSWQQLLFEFRVDRLILLDGAEQLSAPFWQYVKWISARTQGLIITSHRAGLLPTAIDCSTDIDLFKEILIDLLNGNLEISDQELTRLYKKYHGNLREAFRELYDRYAQKE